MSINSISHNLDIFETIKQIPIEGIIERYSPNPLINKGGKLWTLCPFHEDRNPSLSLRGQRWRCFGCGASGDGADFVAKLYGLPLIDTAKAIANDFGFNCDQPLTIEQKQRIQARYRKQKLEKLWRQQIFTISRNLAEARRALLLNLDKLPNPEAKAFTVELIDQALNVLDFGTLEEQLKLIESGTLGRWLHE
ncbi:MAG TPA: CHC2 zinc finger domain-containing protein [Desulfitobacteriaceae bacterium]|nr:CHC2 zinc finger domain-containing protein [Desulfitobacteriaceae bacterium]